MAKLVDPRAIVELAEVRGVTVTLGERSVEGSEPRPGQPVGELGDFVLDLESGRLSHATVATRSATRTVPANLLTWNEERKTWVLGMSPTEFAEAPEFDLAELGAEGAAVRKGREGGQKVEKPVARLRHMLLGDLSKVQFQATDAPLGDHVETVIHADEPTVAFVKVMASVGDGATRKEIAIPWPLCKLTDARDKAGKSEVRIDASLAEIQSAPVPDAKAEGRRLSDAKFRARLYAHFGVEPPSFDARLGTPR